VDRQLLREQYSPGRWLFDLPHRDAQGDRQAVAQTRHEKGVDYPLAPLAQGSKILGYSLRG